MPRPLSTDPSGLTILQVATSAGGTWFEMTLRLFKNDFTPGPDSVAADFEEADFDGYTAQAALGRLALGHNEEGIPTVWWETVAFTKSGAVTSNVIFGWYITSVAGTTIWVARRLDEPISLSQAAQVAVISPEYTWRE